MADHQNKYEDYTVEDYFTEISEDSKVVRINLICENGKKLPFKAKFKEFTVIKCLHILIQISLTL